MAEEKTRKNGRKKGGCKEMKRRLLAGLLTLIMALSLLPCSALAAGPMRAIKDGPDTVDTYVFMKNASTELSRQTVKAGDTLVQPETPSQAGWHFTGWKNAENQEPTFGTVAAVTGATHTYTAQWESAYYVYFMASDKAGAEVIYSEQVAANGKVTRLPVCHTEHQRNAGWKTADDTPFDKNTPVTGDTVVVPVMHDCWWVTFDTQGGQPVVSQYVEQEHSLNSLPEALRTGYIFKGWSTDKDGKALVTAPYTPSGAVTLYAQWEPAEVNYTIVYWGENADDTDYSVLATNTGRAKTGTEVSIQTAQLPSSYSERTHFEFRRADTVTIAGDGSSVMNVYFARKQYTITFPGMNVSTEPRCGKVEHEHTDSCCKRGGLSIIHWWHSDECCKLNLSEHTHTDACYQGDYKIVRKYDADISSIWETDPIQSRLENGYVFTSSVTGKNYSFLQKMPGQDMTLTEYYYGTSGYTYRWFYYLEVLDGKTPAGAETKTYGGKTYYKYHTSEAYSNRLSLTYDEDYFPLTGFQQKDKQGENGWDWDRDENVYKKDFTWNRKTRCYEAELYYTRTAYQLTLHNYNDIKEENVLFEADISQKGATPARPASFSKNAVFKGWYQVPPDEIGADTKPYDFTGKTMPAKKLVLYAYWQEQPVTLTVMGPETPTSKPYTGEYTVGTVISTTDVYQDAMKAIKEEEDEAAYWLDEHGNRVDVDSALGNDLTIHPVLKSEAEATYKVTYQSSTTTDTREYRSGAAAEAGEYSGNGTHFLYWEDTSGHHYYPGAAIRITGDVELTPVFGTPVTIETTSLTYHANFENAAPASAEVKDIPVNSAYTVLGYRTDGTASLPTRPGYDFTGWNMQEDGNGKAYKADDIIYLDAKSANHLYAQWALSGETKELYYTVEYYLDGELKDTARISEWVQVLQPDTLEVDPDKINTRDYFGAGKSLVRTAPSSIPEEVKTGAVIKIYYETDQPEERDDLRTYLSGMIWKDFRSQYGETTSETFTAEVEITKEAIAWSPKPVPVQPEVTVEPADINEPEKVPGEEPKEEPAEEPTEEPKEEPAKEPEKPAEEPKEEPEKNPAPAEEPDEMQTLSGVSLQNANSVEFPLTLTGTTGRITPSATLKAFDFSGNGAVSLPDGKYRAHIREIPGDNSDIRYDRRGFALGFTVKNGKIETREIDVFDDGKRMPAGDKIVFTNVYTKQGTENPPEEDDDDYWFAIEKVDAEDGHALNGAVFELYQRDSRGNKLAAPRKTTARWGTESGIALFSVSATKTSDGGSTWYYREITAPEGYALDTKEYEISTRNFYYDDQSKAVDNAKTVRNYRSATPSMLNDAEHFAYVIGYRDGNVRPYGLISRAETTTIFFRLLKAEVRDGNLLTSNTYTDVANDYWANTAISTMTGLGIVQGRSATTFDPKAPITRAQFAAICARFDTGKSEGTQSFTDIQGHWAQTYIERAAELGWIKGFEDGTFRPDTYITRAQAMTMINRVLNRTPEDEEDLLAGMNVWPDCNPGDWFYLAVQEATNSHDYKYRGGEVWTAMTADPDWTRYEN